jgi:hypothetical protein
MSDRKSGSQRATPPSIVNDLSGTADAVVQAGSVDGIHAGTVHNMHIHVSAETHDAVPEAAPYGWAVQAPSITPPRPTLNGWWKTTFLIPICFVLGVKALFGMHRDRDYGAEFQAAAWAISRGLVGVTVFAAIFLITALATLGDPPT